MSDDENQILIPPSFEAVYRDARGRLSLPRTEFRARYEWCEDMAQLLVERAQEVFHGQGVSEDLVLQRMHDGLASEGSGFSADEAAWVTTRLAELLDWPWAARPQAAPAPQAHQDQGQDADGGAAPRRRRWAADPGR